MGLQLFLQALFDGIAISGVYAVSAVGLTIVFGVLGIVNFAHGTFLMISMYAVYSLFTKLGVGPYFAMAVTIPLLFVMGMLFYRVLIKPILGYPDINHLLLTIGVAFVLESIILLIYGPDFYSLNPEYTRQRIKLITVTMTVGRAVAFFTSLVVVGLIYFLLQRTDIGRMIRAVAEDRRAALLMGINADMVYAVAMGIGLACVAVAGSILSPMYFTTPTVGSTFTVLAFVTVVLGGLGNFVGTLVGAVILGLTNSFAQLYLSGSMAGIAPYALLVVVLLFRPQGIFGHAGRSV